MKPTGTVLIQGVEWTLADVFEEIQWCRTKSGWGRRKWKNRPALVDKHHSSPYTGQQFDASKVRLDPTGWDHDHCFICQWSLHESDDPDTGEGYSYDGKTWVCIECFEKQVLGGVGKDVS